MNNNFSYLHYRYVIASFCSETELCVWVVKGVGKKEKGIVYLLRDFHICNICILFCSSIIIHFHPRFSILCLLWYEYFVLFHAQTQETPIRWITRYKPHQHISSFLQLNFSLFVGSPILTVLYLRMRWDVDNVDDEDQTVEKREVRLKWGIAIYQR